MTPPASNKPKRKPPRSERRRQLGRETANIDAALPGSIVIRHARCGKPNCRCHQDPPQLHGPYIQWTRKINGRTRTRLLTNEQYERYRPWFENARLLRELLSELEALSLQAARETEGWPPDDQP
ncbi:MAG: DUF6788 family protein [Solirubrobacteraceae bacterium]